MRYSIEGQELTDIADALRRKHGETKMGTIIVDEIIPSVIISKTPNATGFDSYNGLYEEEIIEKTTFSVCQIPNASTIKIKVAYQFSAEAGDYLEIASGNFPNSTEWQWATGSKICKSLYNNGIQIKEFEFANTDVITLRLMIYKTFHSHFYLGYYAEITGYDADGNPIGEDTIQVEKEVEVPNTYASNEMAQAIDDIEIGVILPDEAYVLTGDISYRFSNKNWNWFIEQYGNKITSQDIRVSNYVFNNNSTITEIPFEFNFVDGISCNSIFSGCSNLKNIPKLNFVENQTAANTLSSGFKGCNKVTEIDTIKNVKFASYDSLFESCYRLRYPPKFENCNWDSIHTNGSYGGRSLFANCYSLREYPQEVLDNHWGKWTSYLYALFYQIACCCYALDEIKGVNPTTGAISSASNLFNSSFYFATRLKDFTFKLQDDGTPYVVKWKGATMDFSQYCGWSNDKSNLLNFNSGITEDKEVYDDTTYQALKDDKDWFTMDVAYSRYNKTSALNTINTLPDTSAYGTNTIKFKGLAGSATDGGAINTLTAEQIATATAKGWTVSFV